LRGRIGWEYLPYSAWLRCALEPCDGTRKVCSVVMSLRIGGGGLGRRGGSEGLCMPGEERECEG
jgi:hypothetical protein